MYKYQSLQAGQLPWEHSYFLQDLLNFIILKKLKQEAHDDFRAYVYERSSCDLLVIWVTNPMEKYLMDFYQGVGFTTQIW